MSTCTLQPASAPPPELGLADAAAGVLYLGPLGPAYADIPGGPELRRQPVRVRGAQLGDLRTDRPLGEILGAIDGGVRLLPDGPQLRREGRGVVRAGELVVTGGGGDVARWRRRRGRLVLERPSGEALIAFKRWSGEHELAGDPSRDELASLMLVAAAGLSNALVATLSL